MTRGGGRIFKRKGSGFWWVSFYVRGKEVRQSTGVEHLDGTQANDKKKTSAEKKALNFLKQKSDEKSADRMGLKTFVGPEQRRIKISKLLDALAKDFALRQKDSPQLQSHLRSVHVYFGACRAVEVTSEMVDAYIEERLSAGAMPASVNRNTQILGQAFKLAIRSKHLWSGPSIRRLSEKGNVRQGFLSNTEIRAVIENLADYLGDLTLFGYLSGWRRGEIVSLEWPDIDGDVIRLRPENSKNGEGRMLVLEGELAELIERRRVARRIETADGPMLAALVFHHAGHKIGNFRKAWGESLPHGWRARQVVSRPSQKRRPGYDPLRCAGAHRDELVRAQDAEHALPVLYHQRRRSARSPSSHARVPCKRPGSGCCHAIGAGAVTQHVPSGKGAIRRFFVHGHSTRFAAGEELASSTK